MTKSLDLYAKIEPLIGFYDAYESLYNRYLKLMDGKNIQTVLDIGCGNGSMLVHLQKDFRARGIDLSASMVERAKAKGVDAVCMPVSAVTQTYDAVLAVADVLNYLPPKELPAFLRDIHKTVQEGGYFICDINTLFGFEEVTAGSMSVDEGDQFLSIEADFEDDMLSTHITYFEETQNGLFAKSNATILQYYYEVAQIEAILDMTLVEQHEIILFGDEADKVILVFQKGEKR